MSFWVKFGQWLPIVMSTSAAVGLFTIKIDDEHTKRIVRVIAVILGIGSVFTVISQVPRVLGAVEDGYKIGRRMLGYDEDSQISRLKREAEVLAEQARVAAAARAAAAADEQAKEDAARRQHDRDAAQRAALLQAEKDKQALEAARAKAAQDRQDAIRRQSEADAAAKAARDRAEAEQEERRRIAAAAANAYCSRCCSQNAPPLYPSSTQVVSVCLSECTSQKSSNWFGNGAVLCRR